MTRHLTRREFLETAAVTAGAAALTTGPAAAAAALPRRPFGKAGFDVPILAFGCGSRFLMYKDEETALQTLNSVIDSGITYLDTAVGYGNGEGEWDPHRLAQAVSYLVEGALAAAPAEPKVRVRWRGTEEYVLLAIERDATPEDAGGPRLDDHFGAAVGGGSERGVRTYVARKILGQHRASLVRFATHETVTYVANIYKYYLAYQMMAQGAQARRDAKTHGPRS